MTMQEADGREGVSADFLELSQRIYKDDPRWIPEDPEVIAADFSDKNSYFKRGEARSFCIPGKVRAAAFFDPQLRVDGESVAYAGYYESVGDADANAELFARIEAWAGERGAKTLYGPIQWTTERGYRLRTSAEPGAIPFLGEPYNPDSYPQQWQSLGFSITRNYVSQLLPMEQVHKALSLFQPVRESLIAEGYRFEVPTPKIWLQHLPRVYEMADAIFAQNFAYTRVSYETFSNMFAPAVMRKVCQLSSVLVLAPDGSPAAFGLSYPFYGPLVVQGRGPARIPVKDLDYRRHSSLLAALPPRCCIGKTLGVHPAHRRKGIKEALLLLGFERGMPAYDIWIAALIREDNNASRRVFEHVAVGERKYALYSKRLQEAV